MNEPKYIQFVFSGYSETGKTSKWNVTLKDDPEDMIGYVKWFGRWRCYAFFSMNDSVFEKQCLRDIANFCEFQTELHKKVTREVKE